MKKEYQKIWDLAFPYLQKGVKKNFVIHTEGVFRAIELILEKEKADEEILSISSILHDVGWALVPESMQKEKNNQEAEKLHVKFAPRITREILRKLKFPEEKIKKVVGIVKAHKFCRPRNLEKRILIDADNLSDCFKEQFYQDVKEYGVSNENNFYHREKNWFYTKTAKEIFEKEMEKRKKEIFG